MQYQPMPWNKILKNKKIEISHFLYCNIGEGFLTFFSASIPLIKNSGLNHLNGWMQTLKGFYAIPTNALE